ncbi:hypothetical protein LTR40_010410 [Exophiala xenobiotica]|nr:hypothetical protein LTR40_010410 [Exophiala xenobiotica]KAK5560101.1 hypothetical protein LTR46_001851 [Exophiala xenobiotica]
MPSSVFTPLMLLVFTVLALALPPQPQTYLASQDNLPAWAADVKPPSITHNLHPDEVLPIPEDVRSVVSDTTGELPSAPTSLLALLQDDW